MCSAYESYVIATPLIGNQNFLTLTTHVIMEAPNYTATAAEMGYAANVTQTMPEYSFGIRSAAHQDGAACNTATRNTETKAY